MAGRTRRSGRGGSPGDGPRPSRLPRSRERAGFPGPPHPFGPQGPSAPNGVGHHGARPQGVGPYDSGPYDSGFQAAGPHGTESEDTGPQTASRSPGRRPRRPGSLPPIVYFGAAGVVVLVVALAAAAVLTFTGGSGHHGIAAPKVTDVRTEGLGASAYSQAASTSAFAAIADRSKDRKPLTATEAFGTKKITDSDAKATLKLTASSLDSRCTDAIWGTRLAGLLRQGACTQAVRAAYEDKHFAALVTIFNLATSRAADQVVADADPKSGNGFPIVPPKASPFDQGFSTARGVAMGHYAVITWVRRADGTGDESDAALLSLLVTAGRPTAVLERAAG